MKNACCIFSLIFLKGKKTLAILAHPGTTRINTGDFRSQGWQQPWQQPWHNPGMPRGRATSMSDLLEVFRQVHGPSPPASSAAPAWETPACSPDPGGADELEALLAKVEAGPLARMGGTTMQLQDGSILAKQDSTCACGSQAWRLFLTSRRCARCAVQDGLTPQEILGQREARL